MGSRQKEAAKQISERKTDIKYDTRDLVIDYLVAQFDNDEYYVQLDYQRNFVWDEQTKCRFIESVLMGLPIPLMFFADTSDGRTEIVDGAQRMQTMVQFVQNDLRLSGLDILTESNGMTFDDMDISVRRRFLKTIIRVVYLEEGTTESVRQEIFKRINTSGKKLTASEARRGSYEGKFKDFLEECTKNELFNQLAPRTADVEARYEGFELAARFFAYFDGYHDNFKGYGGNVARYIDSYVDQQNTVCEKAPERIDACKKRFEDMLEYANKLLGPRGFRKTEKSRSTPHARYEALAVGIALALEKNPKLSVADTDWIDSDEFKKVTRSDAANNKSHLKARIDFVKNRLLKG